MLQYYFPRFAYCRHQQPEYIKANSTEALRKKVEKSCENMIKTAEDAIAAHANVKSVLIMNHAPRFDKKEIDPLGVKSKLAIFANNHLQQLWLDSPNKDKIFIGRHSLECSADVRAARYTDGRTGNYDGVHFYSYEGQTAFTESVLNMIFNSFGTNEETHFNCTQATHMNKQYKDNNNKPEKHAPTRNRFNPLHNQGN